MKIMIAKFKLVIWQALQNQDKMHQLFAALLQTQYFLDMLYEKGRFEDAVNVLSARKNKQRHYFLAHNAYYKVQTFTQFEYVVTQLGARYIYFAKKIYLSRHKTRTLFSRLYGIIGVVPGAYNGKFKSPTANVEFFSKSLRIMRFEDLNAYAHRSLLDKGFRNLRTFVDTRSKRLFRSPIKDFGRLETFVCSSYVLPVHSFCNLVTFQCYAFNHLVSSFGNLQNFICQSFNRPVQSFDKLKKFECFFFNQPVQNFGLLREFNCDRFNQPIVSFGVLEKFHCTQFQQPVLDFGRLHTFSAHFNHPLPSNTFGKHMHSFFCRYFNQTVDSFGNLQIFQSNYFNQPISNFGKLEIFHCRRFNQEVQSFDDLQHFYSEHFIHFHMNLKLETFKEYVCIRQMRKLKQIYLLQRIVALSIVVALLWCFVPSTIVPSWLWVTAEIPLSLWGFGIFIRITSFY